MRAPRPADPIGLVDLRYLLAERYPVTPEH